MTDAEAKPPLELLIENTEKVLAHLIRTRDAAEKTLASRKGEIKTVEAGLRQLKKGRVEQANGHTPLTRTNNFTCKSCGNHAASKAHKDACGSPSPDSVREGQTSA